ncbi:MAG: M1 family metallopeptidase [Thermoplasmata archaeon]
MRVERYRLHLVLDAPQPTFHGTVEIEIVDAPAHLVVHALGLTPKQVQFNGSPASVEVHADDQEWVLRGTPAAAHARVRLEFEGSATDSSLVGYYRSRFGHDHIFSTDFEPASARQAFPCIDRPDQKAIFEAEIEAASDQIVIFNTPAVEIRPAGERRRWKFQPTPPMATYLVFWGVGPFQEKSSHAFRIPVHLAYPKGREDSTGFALDATPRLLAAFEAYYGVPYPLPKLHLVPVAEYGAGAMENWGAITFRERILLIEPKSSVNLRRLSASVISHELAHMWFGDLVTMAWWNDLWLNESFATFMGTKMQDRVFPEHEAFSTLLVGRTAGALVLDGMDSTHPIRVEVKSPLEIRQVFDGISYGKGASVLRMIEAYLGEAAFRRGVHEYLKEFAFGNSRGSDLWRHLSKASDQPVDRILETWTGVSGYPVLFARRTDSTVRITQHPFRYLGTPPPQLWPVPLTYRIGATEGRLLMEEAEAILEAPVGVPVLLNAGRRGFYRVEYDAAGYEALARVWPDLAPVDRWGLLDDLYALLQAGRVDFAQYRRWVERALDTSDHILVVQIEGQLTALARLVNYAGPVAALQQEFLALQRHRLGLDPKPGEPENHAAEREPILIESAVSDRETARTLADRFPRYADQDPSVRTGVLIGRVREGGPEGFTGLRAALLTETRDEEGVRLVNALAYARSADQLQALLELTLSGQVSRIYLVQALITASGSPEGVGPSWTFFRSHLDEIRKVVQGTPFVSSLPEFCLPRWGLADGPAVRDFLAAHPLPEMDRGIRKGLERLQILEGIRARLPKA